MMSTAATTPPKPSAPPPETTEPPNSQSAPTLSPFIDLSQAIRSAPGTPTWEMARFYPAQGEWTENEYFALSDNTGIEFVDGQLEFLPMPTKQHHRIMQFLYRLLDEFVRQHKLGEVFVMGYPVKTSPRKLREPDVFFVVASRETSDSFATGCDLAMEVVSPGSENRDRDVIHKRQDYAAAGIAEYWIVDPQTQSITVLTLPEGGGEYAMHGGFTPGGTASSVLLEGFTVDVTACFAAAEQAE